MGLQKHEARLASLTRSVASRCLIIPALEARSRSNKLTSYSFDFVKERIRKISRQARDDKK